MFFGNIMAETPTGMNRIGLLVGAAIAHKTGSSFRNAEGFNAAENDIGIMQRPNGTYYSLAVFVVDSMEDEKNNCKMISNMAK